jgi:hypothetical protein
MTLSEFLLARYAEDEAGILTSAGGYDEDWWVARQVADIAAKRRVVALHAGNSPSGLVTLTILAQPYADHEDFDPVWRLPQPAHTI